MHVALFHPSYPLPNSSDILYIWMMVFLENYGEPDMKYIWLGFSKPHGGTEMWPFLLLTLP